MMLVLATPADGGVANVYLNAGGDPDAGARILSDLARRYADWQAAGETVVERSSHL